MSNPSAVCLPGCVALVCGMLPIAIASAQPVTIIELGEPTSNSSVSTAGISDAQEVVGRSNGQMFLYRAGQHLFLSPPGGEDNFSPSDMSPAGLIVGSFNNNLEPLRAFTLDATTLAFTELPAATTGNPDGWPALAVSDDGTIVLGEARNFFDGTTGHVRRPLLWTNSGPAIDIGSNNLLFTLISDVNNDGDVVGTARVIGSPVEWHGYARIDGTWMDIGGLGGNRTDARAINNHGVVTGNSRNASNQNTAFVWSFATQQVEALMPPFGFSSSVGRDINDAGTIVGTANVGSSSRAVYWPVGAFRAIDLNTFLPPNSGWLRLEHTWKIDSCGVIIGTGIRENRPGFFSGFMMVLPEYDRDGDGLADCWELNGIDLNGDGTVDLDLPAMGADPMRKDLFVEIDAMVGRAPSPATIARVTTAFANAPVTNLDGTTGITLHPIIDETNLTLADFPNNFTEFDPLKKLHFGSPADRTSSNAAQILKARRLVFRYCIFANTYDGDSSSGLAELGGNDLMVTLGAWSPAGGTPDEQAGTFMHEFGHTLNLNHGGGDGINYKPNYYSIMNYAWQTPTPAYSGWRLDYSRVDLPDLNESDLIEAAGLGGAAGSLPSPQIPFRAKDNTAHKTTSTGPEPFDWDNDGSISLSPVTADLNRFPRTDPPSPGEILTGYDDWANLVYNFRFSPSFADGIHETADELTFEQFAQVRDEFTQGPPCPVDLSASANPNDPGYGTPDGTADANDLFYYLDRFAAGDLATADLTGSADPNDPGFGVPDGQLTADDFSFFLSLFASGCS